MVGFRQPKAQKGEKDKCVERPSKKKFLQKTGGTKMKHRVQHRIGNGIFGGRGGIHGKKRRQKGLGGWEYAPLTLKSVGNQKKEGKNHDEWNQWLRKVRKAVGFGGGRGPKNPGWIKRTLGPKNNLRRVRYERKKIGDQLSSKDQTAPLSKMTRRKKRRVLWVWGRRRHQRYKLSPKPCSPKRKSGGRVKQGRVKKKTPFERSKSSLEKIKKETEKLRGKGENGQKGTWPLQAG